MNSLLLLIGLSFVAADPPSPRVHDDRLEITLFASEPQVTTPTGIAVDDQGAVYVVENNTHFRPKEYNRPELDRILRMQDTDGDGRADKVAEFYTGLKNTMSIAFEVDGSLLVATRADVFRLRDKNGDGKADERSDLVKLVTKGEYPHNGLSGFALDFRGNIYFGFGENLGADYKISGADGKFLTGGNEGGNIYCCDRSGKNLRLVATGFWNPFHLAFDTFGRLFTVDNDPDSRPPCRLLHVVGGGDYGFRFRNGRKGVSPFTAWNGELPATLPMVCGTGEAPCAVLAYESDNLPPEYRGELLVTSWGDHRLERYTLQPRGASFGATMKPVVTGDQNFRPVGLAMAPDGSLFMSDWVDKSYPIHGKGRIWHLRAKKPEKRQTSHRVSPVEPQLNASLGAAAANATNDPWTQLSKYKSLNSEQRAALLKNLSEPLLVWYAAELQRQDDQESRRLIGTWLTSENADLRFIGIRWAAESKLVEYAPSLERLLEREADNSRNFAAILVALDRISGRNHENTGEYFAAKFLIGSSKSVPAKIMALRMVSPNHADLTVKFLVELSKHEDETLQREAVRTLRLRGGAEATARLQAIVEDEHADEQLRCEALLAENDEKVLAELTQQQKHPQLKAEAQRLLAKVEIQHKLDPRDQTAWQKLAAGTGNPTAGERLFFHPKVASCYKCHEHKGRGGRIGPDLSTVAKSMTRERLLQSLVDPSREIAPQFTPWILQASDGTVKTGVYVGEETDGTVRYADAAGQIFKLHPRDVEDKKTGDKSIMPAGLAATLTPQELRDLLAFLLQN